MRHVSFIIPVLILCAACGGSSTPQHPTLPGTPPLSTARVVPIYLYAWGCLACPQPRITTTFQGRTLTDGYYIFNLEPGNHELAGTLLPSPRSVVDSSDRWDFAFTTYPQLGNAPPIADNGVQINSIQSAAGPNPSYNRAECGVFYLVPDKRSPEFRIRFTVTSSRAANVTCQPQYVAGAPLIKARPEPRSCKASLLPIWNALRS